MKIDPVFFPHSPALTRRNVLRTLALSVGAASLPGWLVERSLFAADPATPPAFVSTPVGEGLTLITGAVCNILVLNGEDGGVVIDSGIPDAAAATASQIAQVAPKLNLLVNTHWHFDHAGGTKSSRAPEHGSSRTRTAGSGSPRSNTMSFSTGKRRRRPTRHSRS